ncbi:acyl-CoA dehydrogenase family protein [Rothia sp. AR01]|uniref:Dibenzothiophene monooxygenase n=1 Tax=Rothia santali TaxID=2949643 RepID=A0A9X2HE18_9MICC|nr:acyl-CoA dehydrogenase family protein [Rothia santali]MCP3426395.1 acyl-CoA dehydrogenase family protein [Rothia santali]
MSPSPAHAASTAPAAPAAPATTPAAPAASTAPAAPAVPAAHRILERPATPHTPWGAPSSPGELARWDDVALRVGEQLAADAVERDAAGQDPSAELRLLKDSGLVDLIIPREFGGGGGTWEAGLRAVRLLSRHDASIAQLLAYHYANVSAVAFYGGAEVQERLFRASAAGSWIWGDAVNPVDPAFSLTPEEAGEGFRLNGRKRFCTGASVGEVTLVNAEIAAGPLAGTTAAFVVGRERPGVRFDEAWDSLGQRLSASGGVTYDDVRVLPEDLVGPVGEVPFSTLVTPLIQLAFSNLYLGIAEGALQRGREITLARRNSWFLSSAEDYAHDPYVERLYGELLAKLKAGLALADGLNRRSAHHLGRGGGLTAAERGEYAVEIAALKIVATDVGLDTTQRIYEATGASSATPGSGLDLFWRNVRTHTLHDPVDYKRAEVGAHFLRGELQPISLYT